MSTEELTRFIHSVEHSYTLRKKLKACQNLEDLLELAREFSFTITLNDLRNYESAAHIDDWFKKSTISPFKVN